MDYAPEPPCQGSVQRSTGGTGRTDPSEPVWEVTEGNDKPHGVSRLAVRIPTLRHRDQVMIRFRLGASADSDGSGRLIVRVSTQNTPKPVVKTLSLVRDSRN